MKGRNSGISCGTMATHMTIVQKQCIILDTCLGLFVVKEGDDSNEAPSYDKNDGYRRLITGSFFLLFI